MSLYIELSSLLVVLIMNIPPCLPGTFTFGQINTQDLSISTASRSPNRENEDFPSDASSTLSEDSTGFTANSLDSTTSLSKPSAEGLHSSDNEGPLDSTTTNLCEDSVELSKDHKRKNASVISRSNRKSKFPLLLLHFTLFY